MKFIGRKKELAALEALYQRGSFSFVTIYGARRVGKTTLIQEFTKDKKAIVFQARKVTMKENLRVLSSIIQDVFSVPTAHFLSLEEVFLFLEKESEKEKIVFVLDEYPCLVKKEKGLSTTIQELIDQRLKYTKNLMLILSGSSLSMMEKEILGEGAPLYKRSDSEIELLPFTYEEASQALKDFPLRTRFDLLSVFSFSPYYLSRLDFSLSFKEIIQKECFSFNGMLVRPEAEILNAELREPDNYSSILLAILRKKDTLTEIAEETGIAVTKLPIYLKKLITIGAVETYVPFLRKGKKKASYRVKDPTIAFYYRFIFPYLDQINLLDPKKLYAQEHSQVEAFLERGAEGVAREFLLDLNGQGRLPTIYTDSLLNDIETRFIDGKKEEAEVDVLLSDKRKNLLLGEVKRGKGVVGLSALHRAERESTFYPDSYNKRIALISPIGFAPDVKEEAKEKNVLLFGPEELSVL